MPIFRCGLIFTHLAGWLDRYPAEMVHYARGPIDFGTTNDIGRAPNASLASERWQQEADVIVKQFLDYLQTTRVGKRVFSFLIGGACGSEWTYFGYKQEPEYGGRHDSSISPMACG